MGTQGAITLLSGKRALEAGGDPRASIPVETSGGRAEPAEHGQLQAPGRHHLVLLHVGQGGPGGDPCRRGGSAVHSTPSCPGSSFPACHARPSFLWGNFTTDPEVWLPSRSGDPALKRPGPPTRAQSPETLPSASPSRSSPAATQEPRLAWIPPPSGPGRTGPWGWGVSGSAPAPFISMITGLHLKAEREPFRRAQPA